MGPVLAVGGCREARTWSLQGGRRPMGPGRAGPMRSSVAAPDCCGGLGNLDFRKADLCVMTRLLGYVDPSEPHFVAAVLTIAFNPLFWNVLHAGHAEPTQDAEPGQPLGLPHGPGTPGSGRRVCPFQFPGSGLHGDLPRKKGSRGSPAPSPLSPDSDDAAATPPALLVPGAQGTSGRGALSDYFGILKETRVTTFPFSVLDNPMYWGSTANYLGWAIMHASPAGLLLTTVVALTYTVAILYEEPFTAEIYRQKASQAHKRS
ncbi:phosphatidylethanolamine N-methyltransferase isoform X7 [Delphinapterus leucas]|uniref:Phosphatidylethanolamine N-methyltransferase n=1 Tax=Delphinapterus leucas TaxID=9749 RepID=A0A2Y9M3P4_DELLE|nr:phosphatidylethanolamine N-methyltransferase isoform X7 [Delphinapterus leucas]